MTFHLSMHRLIVIIVLVFSLFACGSQQEINFEIAVDTPCTLSPGGTKTLSLSGELPSEAQVNWEAGQGTLSEMTELSTVYTAPITETTDSITVRVTVGENDTIKTLDCQIKSETSSVNDLVSTVAPNGTSDEKQLSTDVLPTDVPLSPVPTHTNLPTEPVEVQISETCQSILLKPGNCTEINFTSGEKEKGRQSIDVRVDQPGEYTIVLENTHQKSSGHWIFWDYISLKMGENIAWEIGDDETPPNYEVEAFDEFCDPLNRADCAVDFYVDTTPQKDFPNQINDSELTTAKLHFTLSKEWVGDNLTLLLSTLYSTRLKDNIKNFQMRATLLER